MFARAAEPPWSRTDPFPARPPGREFRWLAVAFVALPLLVLLGHGLSSWAAIWAEATGRAARSADVLREHALRMFETHDAILLGVEQAMQGMGWEEAAASARLHDHIRVLARASSSATGIGLASVRAFAEEAGGAFRITSAPGRGTTVTLRLPEAAC